MQKKVWLSSAMVALGAAMLVAAAFAGSASSKSPTALGQKKGGTMNVNMSATDVDYIDPTLAYGTVSWQILDSTCMKLMFYPDKPDPVGSKLAPDGAVGFPKVSKDGKTYIFTVKSGVKSNTGETLTAANYSAAIDRVLNPKMQSPAVPFITGDNGIVGAQAVADGKATHASGVKAAGQKLTITLLKPDGSLLSKLAMNFFCALPKGTEITADGINAFASFGPYFVASRQVGRQIITKTNPNYKGGRPHNIDTYVFTANTNLDQSLLQVKSGQADYDAGGLPPTAHADLAQQFGVNKGRYFVHGGLNVDYIALNTTRPAFSSATMRKAANFAVDRPSAGADPRQVRGLPQRPAPPAGPWWVQEPDDLPDQGLRLREGQVHRRVELQGRHAVLGQHRHGPAAGAGVQVQPHPDRLQRDREAVPGLPDLHRGRHEG